MRIYKVFDNDSEKPFQSLRAARREHAEIIADQTGGDADEIESHLKNEDGGGGISRFNLTVLRTVVVALTPGPAANDADAEFANIAKDQDDQVA